MKFATSVRQFNEESYNPAPNYYQGPNDPKFNDIYKQSFLQNLAKTDEGQQNFFGKQQRFNYYAEKTPGPGAYVKYNKGPNFQPISDKKETLQTKILKFDKCLKENRIQGAPSIPHVDRECLSDESSSIDNLVVIKDPKEHKKNLDSLNSKIAPGKYNPSDKLTKPRVQVVQFSKEKTNKSKMVKQDLMTQLFLGQMKSEQQTQDQSLHQSKLSQQEEVDEHGKYLKDIQLQKGYTFNQASAGFLKKKRKTFDEMFKHKENAEEEDEDDYDSEESHEQPGPGYYYDAKKYSCFTLKDRPKQFQCFDVKEKRFNPVNSTETNKLIPGVGDYDITAIERKQQLKADFNKASRFQQQKVVMAPGPAEYVVEETMGGQKNIYSNFVLQPPVFGSGAKRFISDKEKLITPGPGQYNIQIKRKRKNRRQVRTIVIENLQGNQQGLPRSNSLQKQIGYNQNNNNYNNKEIPSLYPFQNIDEKKNKQVMAGCFRKKGSAAFSSDAQRFLENQKPITNAGPGSYEYSGKQFCKGTFNKLNQLFSQSDRNFLSSKINPNIGPGTYNGNVNVVKKKFKAVKF